MIPRIQSIMVEGTYQLNILFDDGRRVLYDLSEDIHSTPGFSILESEIGLLPNFQLDKSRTIVMWSEEVDLPSDVLYEYGKIIQ